MQNLHGSPASWSIDWRPYVGRVRYDVPSLSSTEDRQMTTDTDVLEYRPGVVMDERTIHGLSIQDVANELVNHRYCFVEIEPGDATNYQFHIILDAKHGGLLVIRQSGGEYRTSFLHSVFGPYEVGKLSIGNDWTGVLLTWYFKKLFLAMKE